MAAFIECHPSCFGSGLSDSRTHKPPLGVSSVAHSVFIDSVLVANRTACRSQEKKKNTFNGTSLTVSERSHLNIEILFTRLHDVIRTRVGLCIPPRHMHTRTHAAGNVTDIQ